MDKTSQRQLSCDVHANLQAATTHDAWMHALQGQSTPTESFLTALEMLQVCALLCFGHAAQNRVDKGVAQKREHTKRMERCECGERSMDRGDTYIYIYI
jgi:hypothetical protein